MTRRRFLAASVASGAAALAAPAVVSAGKTNIDTWRELLVVPELFGRVSILDGRNRVVARLGDDSERIRGDKGFAIRADPKEWKPGLFVHPHDACFDREGNLLVAEWVATGRVTRLRRLG